MVLLLLFGQYSNNGVLPVFLSVVPDLDPLFADLQALLAQAGLNVSIGVLKIAAALLAVVILCGIISGIIEGVTRVVQFGQKQVGEKFWRDAGKTTTLINFILLVIAYAFYGHEQTRTVIQAVIDLGKEQLDTVLPLAILTQWVLLLGFLALFGWIMRVPMRSLFHRVTVIIGGWILFAALMVFCTAWAYPLVFGGFDSVAWTSLGVTLLGLYLAAVATNSPEQRRANAEWLRQRGWFVRLLFAGGSERSRWRVPPFSIIILVLALLLCDAVTAYFVFVFYDKTLATVPSREVLIRVQVVVSAFIALMSCFFYRQRVASQPEVPAALFAFIDFSMALSACAIALSGLGESAVTLGRVPVWTIAIGPPIIVALLVFTTNVLRLRSGTTRWGTCLFAAVMAGPLVWPAKEALHWLLRPLVELLLELLPLPKL